MNTEVARAVLETRKPYVSDVMVGAVSGTELISVVVPVMRTGEVAYFLIGSLPLSHIRKFSPRPISRRGGPTATVADRKGKVLAVLPGGSSELTTPAPMTGSIRLPRIRE